MIFTQNMKCGKNNEKKNYKKKKKLKDFHFNFQKIKHRTDEASIVFLY